MLGSVACLTVLVVDVGEDVVHLAGLLSSEPPDAGPACGPVAAELTEGEIALDVGGNVVEEKSEEGEEYEGGYDCWFVDADR